MSHGPLVSMQCTQHNKVLWVRAATYVFVPLSRFPGGERAGPGEEGGSREWVGGEGA